MKYVVITTPINENPQAYQHPHVYQFETKKAAMSFAMECVDMDYHVQIVKYSFFAAERAQNS